MHFLRISHSSPQASTSLGSLPHPFWMHIVLVSHRCTRVSFPHDLLSEQAQQHAVSIAPLGPHRARDGCLPSLIPNRISYRKTLAHSSCHAHTHHHDAITSASRSLPLVLLKGCTRMTFDPLRA